MYKTIKPFEIWFKQTHKTKLNFQSPCRYTYFSITGKMVLCLVFTLKQSVMETSERDIGEIRLGIYW